MSNDFRDFCNENGIERRHTTRNRPQQNGVAERTNRTMAEDITAMLNQAKLPASFWEFAMGSQIYIRNRLPTAYLPDKTLHKAATKRKPDIGHFRV